MSNINHHHHNNNNSHPPHDEAQAAGDQQPHQPRPLTSDDFQAMIPAHFLSGGRAADLEVNDTQTEAGSTVTVKVRKGEPDLPMFPAAPTELGTIKETITKSTFTEMVMTRITDNRLAEPLIIEVIMAPAAPHPRSGDVLGSAKRVPKASLMTGVRARAHTHALDALDGRRRKRTQTQTRVDYD